MREFHGARRYTPGSRKPLCPVACGGIELSSAWNAGGWSLCGPCGLGLFLHAYIGSKLMVARPVVMVV